MDQEYFKNFDAFGKNAFEATRKLIEMNGRVFEKVLEGQLGVANLFVESSEKASKLAKEANDPQVYMKKQSALYEEYAGKFADAAQDNAKLIQEAGEDLKVWFENGVENADKAGKAVVETATKATKTATRAASKKAA